MEHVLVAGATGYLGGFVAREFKARGHFVRALAVAPPTGSHSLNDYYLEWRLA